MQPKKVSEHSVQNINYLLERKNVKNLNLRIRKDGSVYVSASPRVPLTQIDDFVSRHSAYIQQAQQRLTDLARRCKETKQYSKDECLAVFNQLLTELYPRIKPYGAALPGLRVRKMTSRWGSCQTIKGIITLNTQLLAAPQSCIEYVIMHELCHLLQPNHSRQFYALLTQLMPDWPERKPLLNQTPIALN